MAATTVVPGGTKVIRVQVRKYDGSLAVLDGGSYSSLVKCSGVADDAAYEVLSPDSQTRLFVLSGAQTAARAGKQVRLRTFIQPAGSYETVATETLINVGRT